MLSCEVKYDVTSLDKHYPRRLELSYTKALCTSATMTSRVHTVFHASPVVYGKKINMCFAEQLNGPTTLK
jgi:hypothetical protein